jgi:hypothetical protein
MWRVREVQRRRRWRRRDGLRGILCRHVASRRVHHGRFAAPAAPIDEFAPTLLLLQMSLVGSAVTKLPLARFGVFFVGWMVCVYFSFLAEGSSVRREVGVTRPIVRVFVVLAGVVSFLVGCDKNDSGGEFECSGADCVCPASGDCRVHCLDACNLQCAGSGACDFVCDEGCVAACTGSGLCVVSVADDSTVQCPGSGGCDVDCNGDCAIECPGSGDCIARCEPGFACSIERCSGSVQSCPNGIQVCNGPCPPQPS